MKEIEEEEYKEDVKLDIDEIELGTDFEPSLNDEFEDFESDEETEEDMEDDWQENELDNLDDSEFEGGE